MTTPTATAEEGTSPFKAGLAALRQGEWDEGRALIEAGRATGAVPDAEVRLLLAVADIRTGRADVDVLADHAITAGDLGDLRRLLVNPLVSEGAPARAVRVLDAMIAACPPGLRDLRQRAGLHARLRDWDAAIADADTVATIDPADTFTQAMRLQYRLQAGRTAEAAAIVDTIGVMPADERVATFMLLVLLREGRLEQAADRAQQVDI